MRDAASAALEDCQFGQAVESRNSSSKLHGLRTTQATRRSGRRIRHFLITHDCHREAAAALRARIRDLRRARGSAGKRPRLPPINGKGGLLRSGGMIELWQLKVQPPSHILPESAIGPSRQGLLAAQANVGVSGFPPSGGRVGSSSRAFAMHSRATASSAALRPGSLTTLALLRKSAALLR